MQQCNLRFCFLFISLMQVNNNFLSVGNADKEVTVMTETFACCFFRKEKNLGSEYPMFMHSRIFGRHFSVMFVFQGHYHYI